MWEVWGGMRSMQKVSNYTPRFCGEFGLPSMPSANVLDEFISGEQINFYGEDMAKRHCKIAVLSFSYFNILLAVCNDNSVKILNFPYQIAAQVPWCYYDIIERLLGRHRLFLP